MTYKQWNTGDVLSASALNAAADQLVFRFADATARDAAITSPVDGHVCWLTGTNELQVYAGAAWVTVSDPDVLVVDSANSRVGIGTTSPAANLQVVSENRAFSVLDTGVTNNAEAGFTTLGGTDPAYGAISGYDVQIKTGTTRAGLATRLHVDNDGNVGIGTTSPTVPLDIHNATAVEINLNDSGGTVGTATNAKLQFQAGGADAGHVGFENTSSGIMTITQENGPLWINQRSANNILFRTSNTTQMLLDSSGRLGIGKTNPQTALDVVGTITASDLFVSGLSSFNVLVNDSTYVQIGNTSSSSRVFEMVSLGSVDFVVDSNNNSTSKSFTWRTNGEHGAGTALMRLTDTGRLGIGATAPGDMCDVGSSGNLGSFRVHASGGSESFRVSGTVVRSVNIKNLTTGSAANVHINTSNNSIYRSTSSIKYKTDVETMEDTYADAILGLRPVWYRSLGPDDPDSWGYWGFIAEEVAEVDPRLVSFGVPADYERQYDEDDEPIDPDVVDMTEPEGVQYDRIVPHLVNLVARQRDQISGLIARIEALEVV